jgi:hypothetical protein
MEVQGGELAMSSLIVPIALIEKITPHSNADSRKRINLFLHDLSEMEEKKSPIFSLPFHSNHVKRDLSLNSLMKF